MIDTTLIEQYIEAYKDMKRKEEAWEEAKKVKNDMADKLHTVMASEGCNQVKVFGITVAPKRTLRARAAQGTALLAEALKAEGLDALVSETVNANTLSSWVREHDPDRLLSPDQILAKLPPEIRENVAIYEQLDISLTPVPQP